MVPQRQAGLLDGLQDYKQYQLSVVRCIQCNTAKEKRPPNGRPFCFIFSSKKPYSNWLTTLVSVFAMRSTCVIRPSWYCTCLIS